MRIRKKQVEVLFQEGGELGGTARGVSGEPQEIR